MRSASATKIRRDQRAQLLPTARLATAAPTGSTGGLYRDVLLLVAGAVIGIASGLVTSFVQGELQRQQQLYDKRFALLREAIEFNNFTSSKLLSLIDETDSLLQRTVESIESTGRAPKDFDQQLERIAAAYKPEKLNYESRVDMFFLMLYTSFGEPGSSFRLDPKFIRLEPPRDVVKTADTTPHSAGATPVISNPKSKIFRDLQGDLNALRELGQKERDRVNAELARLAEKLAK